MWVKPSLCESHETSIGTLMPGKDPQGVPSVVQVTFQQLNLLWKETVLGLSQSQNQPKQNQILEPKKADSPW